MLTNSETAAGNGGRCWRCALAATGMRYPAGFTWLARQMSHAFLGYRSPP